MTTTNTDAQAEAIAALAFNPFDPAFRADPYPTYLRLRTESPVHRSPFGGLVLSRYADCVAMLRDPRSGNDSTKTDEFREQTIAQGLDPDEVIANSTRPFLFMDPPDHTRLRGIVNKAFTPRVVETLRPRIEQIVGGLIDAIAVRGEFDVIEDVAYPLPVQVICEMLGVPPEDHVKFRDWSREAARSLDPDFILPPDVQERRQKMFDAFSAYFAELVTKRRADPRDDLISALIAAEEQGQKLTENEVVATGLLLLIAGHETTVNLIGNGMLTLMRHPDQLARLRAEPALIQTAVEELLRFDPPVQLTARVAIEDIEIGGETLQKGQQAVLLLASANRDPDQFADPERLDLGRQENRHIAFGMGIHFCLGAPLARVEGQIAIGAMVRRLVEPRLLEATPRYKENLVLRGLEALPISFNRTQ